MTEYPLSTTNPWWVIPKHLAGSCKPSATDLAMFRKKGINAIVSLLSDDSNLDLYQQHSISHIWVPVLGGKAPNLEQLNQIQTFVSTQNQLGNAVVIHCSSGRRRTGTVLTALLVQQGKSYENALNIILTINPTIELRETQINFLKNLS